MCAHKHLILISHLGKIYFLPIKPSTRLFEEQIEVISYRKLFLLLLKYTKERRVTKYHIYTKTQCTIHVQRYVESNIRFVFIILIQILNKVIETFLRARRTEREGRGESVNSLLKHLDFWISMVLHNFRSRRAVRRCLTSFPLLPH